MLAWGLCIEFSPIHHQSAYAYLIHNSRIVDSTQYNRRLIFFQSCFKCLISVMILKFKYFWEGHNQLKKIFHLALPLTDVKTSERFFQKFWSSHNIWTSVWRAYFLYGFNDKVHIFWEGYKILRNLHLTFILM